MNSPEVPLAWHNFRSPFVQLRSSLVARKRRRLFVIQNDPMNSGKLKQFRDTLVALHERVGGEVNYVVASIHDDVNIKENVSSAPVHLADVASEAVDADVQVLHTEDARFWTTSTPHCTGSMMARLANARLAGRRSPRSG